MFTSLSTTDSLSDLNSLTPGTWGYSYSNDSGTTWSAYSGLPLYTNAGATLSEKYTPSDDSISFKIAAYATNAQASGEYNNVINFTATAYPHPMTLAESYAYFGKTQTDGYYTMQDMEPGICAVAEDNSTMQVIDLRDHNTYTIAKLADHRCWMTTNLNLEGGTALNSDTTDVDSDYIDSFSTSNNLTRSGDAIVLPAPSTSGFDTDNYSYVYNTNNKTDDCSSPGCYPIIPGMRLRWARGDLSRQITKTPPTVLVPEIGACLLHIMVRTPLRISRH